MSQNKIYYQESIEKIEEIERCFDVMPLDNDENFFRKSFNQYCLNKTIGIAKMRSKNKLTTKMLEQNLRNSRNIAMAYEKNILIMNIEKH